MAEKLKNPIGIQTIADTHSNTSKDPEHNESLCEMYATYYISRRLRNPGRMEDTYVRYLTYHDRHTQTDLMNWMCRRLRECKINSSNLYDEIIKESSAVFQGFASQEYLAETTDFDPYQDGFDEAVKNIREIIGR